MQEDIYILFENYLQNKMVFEEKAAFEEQLLNDNDLREKLELYKETTQFLKTKYSQEGKMFEENLKEIAKNYASHETISSKPKVISIHKKWFTIAATILLFISIWFFIQTSNPKYTDYNEHQKAYFTERSDVNESLKQAQDAFNAKNFKEAVSYFKKTKQTNNLGLEEELYYAISLIEINQYDQAENILNTLKNGKSVYKEKAIWYLGLSKLKQKEYSKCKEYLELLPESAEDYQKAQRILKEL
ncbi:tetratricopeptide repeat protein [Flavobacterium sediminilitoris]|uniref:Tetratricopeptide repeat protein n=1 Tax=Flavobacterium sediminilitoris TaxID=2024526 RepID=A0ABY4HUF6_9FLAO|nr:MULTISPECIES: tetratricopeptide repeat protein [Flavobacterium]UOX35199.1 tetratricopeptide repeat protein [Flavobacterium sediminilitoris]